MDINCNLNRNNEEILKNLKECISSECAKYSYNFDKEDIKESTNKFAEYILNSVKNGKIVLDHLPFIMRLKGKEDIESIIVFDKNSEGEFVYHAIQYPMIIDIEKMTSNEENEFSAILHAYADNLDKDRHYDYSFKSVDKVVCELDIILRPILSKYQYTIADRNNFTNILMDFGRAIVNGMIDGKITLEQVPYLAVHFCYLKPLLYYIVFDKDFKFSIKDEFEYIPKVTLPFDIRIN